MFYKVGVIIEMCGLCPDPSQAGQAGESQDDEETRGDSKNCLCG